MGGGCLCRLGVVVWTSSSWCCVPYDWRWSLMVDDWLIADGMMRVKIPEQIVTQRVPKVSKRVCMVDLAHCSLLTSVCRSVHANHEAISPPRGGSVDSRRR